MKNEINEIFDYFFDDMYADVHRWKLGLVIFPIVSLLLTHLSWWYLLIIPTYLLAFIIKLTLVGIREI